MWDSLLHCQLALSTVNIRDEASCGLGVDLNFDMMTKKLATSVRRIPKIHRDKQS